MNPIQAVLHSEISSLDVRSRAISTIKNPTTIGNARESYLTEFLRKLLPHGISATSGVLCDALGNTSRQLDLVLTLDSSLPHIPMRAGIALIPVESAVLSIEIKSILDSQSLQQMDAQNKSITQLKVAHPHAYEEPFIIPTMIVAMTRSDLSCENVCNWIQHSCNTVTCCVVGEYLVTREVDGIGRIDSVEDGAFNETLAFVARLYATLRHLKMQRDFHPDWGAYLMPLP